MASLSGADRVRDVSMQVRTKIVRCAPLRRRLSETHMLFRPVHTPSRARVIESHLRALGLSVRRRDPTFSPPRDVASDHHHQDDDDIHDDRDDPLVHESFVTVAHTDPIQPDGGSSGTAVRQHRRRTRVALSFCKVPLGPRAPALADPCAVPL